MAKRNGYDPTNPKSRPSEDEKAAYAEYREATRPPREPYDPHKEVVVGKVGVVNADKMGRVKLHVEHVQYNGIGPWRIRVEKRGTRGDGSAFTTANIGFMHPQTAIKLGELLMQAAAAVPADPK